MHHYESPIIEQPERILRTVTGQTAAGYELTRVLCRRSREFRGMAETGTRCSWRAGVTHFQAARLMASIGESPRRHHSPRLYIIESDA